MGSKESEEPKKNVACSLENLNVCHFLTVIAKVLRDTNISVMQLVVSNICGYTESTKKV